MSLKILHPDAFANFISDSLKFHFISFSVLAKKLAIVVYNPTKINIPVAITYRISLSNVYPKNSKSGSRVHPWELIAKKVDKICRFSSKMGEFVKRILPDDYIWKLTKPYLIDLSFRCKCSMFDSGTQKKIESSSLNLCWHVFPNTFHRSSICSLMW